jgi:hypothetical protein
LNYYRQSSGFDFRDGKARIAHGIETLTPDTTIPVPYSAISTVALDAMVTSVLNSSLWNDGVSGNAGLLVCSDGSYGATSGYLEVDGYAILNTSGYNPESQNITGSGDLLVTIDKTYTASDVIASKPTTIPARGTSLGPTTTYTANTGSHQFIVTQRSDGTNLGTHDLNAYSYSTQTLYQMGRHGLTLQSVGDFVFSFEVRHNNTGIHAGVGFMLSTLGGGYVLEFSGAGGTTVKLFKTTKSNAWDNTGDTALKTWTVTSCYNSKSVFKVSVAAGNVFSLYQDGVLNGGGTVTDATYTTGDCFRFVTAYASAGETTIGVISVPGPAGSASGVTGKFIHYNNKLYLGYNANSVADFTFTGLVTASQASNLPAIRHLKCRDMVAWNRDSDPTGGLNSITAKNTFLCAVAGTTLNIYSGETIAYTQTVNSTGCLIVPVNSTTLLVVGTSAENSGLVVIDRLIFTANTWTLATTKTIHLDGGVSGSVVNSYAFNNDGLLYLATYDMSGTIGSMPSRLILITSADLLATNLAVSKVVLLPDFTVRALSSIGTTVYLFGAALEGNYAYSAVIKSDGTFVYKSSKGQQIEGGSQAQLFNFGIATTWQVASGVRFLSQTDLDSWDPVLSLTSSGNVTECTAFDSKQFTYNLPNIVAIAEWNGRFYCLNAQAGTIKRTLTTRGGLGSDFDNLTLELSAMGTNTNLVNKSLFSVIVELSEALPDGEEISVDVNGTTIGTMGSDDGTLKEIVLTAELTATRFITKMVFPQDSAFTGYIKNGPLLKFVPTQFKKKAFSVGIRATRNLRMLDGRPEPRLATTMIADLWTAWRSNTPIAFVDVDGTSYSVLITDIDEREPLIDGQKGVLEALIFLEMLEV